MPRGTLPCLVITVLNAATIYRRHEHEISVKPEVPEVVFIRSNVGDLATHLSIYVFLLV